MMLQAMTRQPDTLLPDPATVREKLAEQARSAADVYLPALARAIDGAIRGDHVLWIGDDMQTVAGVAGGPTPEDLDKLRQSLSSFIQTADPDQLAKLSEAVR